MVWPESIPSIMIVARSQASVLEDLGCLLGIALGVKRLELDLTAGVGGVVDVDRQLRAVLHVGTQRGIGSGSGPAMAIDTGGQVALELPAGFAGADPVSSGTAVPF